MEAKDLKELRIKTGLTVTQAAICVYINPRSWARYESGERKIPEGVVHLFCVQNEIEYPPK